MSTEGTSKTRTTDDKIAFVIAPIGEPDSNTRKRSDQILKYIIEPVTSEIGFVAIRADKITKPGIITTQIIDHIINDPLVIADLTDHNPNVMYELALRHVLKKPVVQLIAEDQILPFDISANRTIKLDYKDLDSVQRAKDDLKKQIEEVIKNPNLVDSPISQAITLDSLKQVEHPLGSVLSNLSSMIGDIGNRLSKIEQNIRPVGSPVFLSGDATRSSSGFFLESVSNANRNSSPLFLESVPELKLIEYPKTVPEPPSIKRVAKKKSIKDEEKH